MFGFLNINKPSGRTSHDVVAGARRLLRVKQIGHAGTLDPAATGVLPLGVGAACRLFRFLPHDKTYVAEVLFGRTTSTDDTQGETVAEAPVAFSTANIEELLPRFSGEIDQIPPMVSAIHIDGERLYKLVREGRAPESIPSRKVTIFAIELLSFEAPVARLRVHCSGGTYIRSIARDLGNLLGCGGCLSSLVREQAGYFHLRDAITLDSISDSSAVRFVQPELALALPFVHLSEEQSQRIRKGQRVEIDQLVTWKDGDHSPQVMALFQEQLIAVCKLESRILHPEVVINR
ncbi:MAG: tRNA pseudouridine(55) synthase TruB [Candidatus Obscuribacterales bacterium]|nr:tRNA pseudouridine(55) synthase TruB [Candidatus Obscuribacterales bacterium]